MKQRLIPAVLLCASIVLIAVGLLQQQDAEVYFKGIRICLECVGIG